MANNDPIYERIIAKRKIVHGIYNYVYFTPYKRQKHMNLLEEILEQVEVCESMLCPISIGKIEEWINNGDIGKVRTEAREIKFAL